MRMVKSRVGEAATSLAVVLAVVLAMGLALGMTSAIASPPGGSIGDTDPDLRRIDLPLTPSDWGVWILSHVDLRATARVRVCREFLLEIIEDQRSLIMGEHSRYI